MAGGQPARGGLTLPTAMVVGPMKAGTSWIHDYLARRDDVLVSRKVKETFFFERNFHRGVEWYAGHFEPTGTPSSAVVEVAPSLFHEPEAPARVRATLGDVPIVVTLREPVARSWSHYLHLRRYGMTDRPLREAVADWPEIILASDYEPLLAAWRERFDSVQALWLEELKSDPEGYARGLCRALGIPEREMDAPISASNVARQPYSHRLARLGNAAAHRLRAAGLYSVVNLAKRLGLKQVFFGSRRGAAAEMRPSDADRAFIAGELERLGAARAGAGHAGAR